CWLTRKMYAILNHPKRAECHPDNPNRHKFIYSWKALQPQFGASYKAQKDFTYRAKQAIEKIERLWSHRTYSKNANVLYQGLNYNYHRGRIQPFPSPPHGSLDAKRVNFYEYF